MNYKPKLVVFISGIVILLLALVFRWISLPPFSNSTETIEPTTTVDIPTSTPSVAAVAKDNIPCISNRLEVTIYQFAIVSLIAINGTGEWGETRLGEEILCWINLDGLDIAAGKASLPVEDFLPPATATPTKTPISTSVPPNITITPPSPIVANEFIVSYDCDNRGKVTGVLYNLKISGGVPLNIDESGNPTYKTVPELPIYASPGQHVTITILSNTDDGEPSEVDGFIVPSASDTSYFKCDGTGNNPERVNPPTATIAPPTPTPIPPTKTPVPPTPVPPTPTKCTHPPGLCK